MEMIEIAQAKGWDHLLIEYDSSLVVQAYESHATVPWWLRIQWSNCWSITCSIHFTISHIFREWNGVLIGLLTLGVCYERQNKGERTTQLRGLGTSIREKDKEGKLVFFFCCPLLHTRHPLYRGTSQGCCYKKQKMLERQKKITEKWKMTKMQCYTMGSNMPKAYSL